MTRAALERLRLRRRTAPNRRSTTAMGSRGTLSRRRRSTSSRSSRPARQHRCLFSTEPSASAPLRVPAGVVLSDLRLEGQPADSAGERLDAVGLVRRGSDGAAAARTAGRASSSRSPASGRSARSRSSGAIRCTARSFSIAAEALTMAATGLVYASLGGPSAPVDVSSLAQTAGWRDRDLLSSSIPALSPAAIALTSSAHVRAGVARGFPVERRQLHGGRAPPAPSPRS